MRNLAITLVLIIGCLGPTLYGGIEVSASVIMKIQVENPSDKEKQTVPVKVYLPKEVNPKDLIDLGGLKLDYDPDMGMYYVHDSVELGPGKSMVKKVEMEDVWVFKEEELSSFVNEAKEMAKQLEGSPYATEAAALVLGIEEKVQGILKKQEETADNPREHIRAYRQGIALIDTVKEDVSDMDRLEREISGKNGQGKDVMAKGASPDAGDTDSKIALGPASDGPPESGAALGRSISMTTAWRIIFVILAFLGALSGVFFMTWRRLVGATTNSEPQGLPLSTGEEETENKLGGPQQE
jgi:uncharacterized protein YneF (UPF0154 family)